MDLQSDTFLSERNIRELQELIQANIDSRDGFRHAAGATSDLSLEGAFEQLAHDRDSQAEDLIRFVTWNGQLPRTTGTLGAAVTRAWLTIREALTPDDRPAILYAMEHGEDSLISAYESILTEDLSPLVADVICRHRAAVKTARDRIQALREALS